MIRLKVNSLLDRTHDSSLILRLCFIQISYVILCNHCVQWDKICIIGNGSQQHSAQNGSLLTVPTPPPHCTYQKETGVVDNQRSSYGNQSRLHPQELKLHVCMPGQLSFLCRPLGSLSLWIHHVIPGHIPVNSSGSHPCSS